MAKSNKQARNHYAIPFYLRSEGEKLQDHFVETSVGSVQLDVLSRIDRKHSDGDLMHKEAAAELRRAADYIDSLVAKPAKKTQVNVVVKATDPTDPAVATAIKAAVRQAASAPSKYKDHFRPEMLAYLASGNPFALTQTGKFTLEQQKTYKSYCFVNITKIVNGFKLEATKMSNGNAHPIKIISPEVDLTHVVPGPAVALDNGEALIIGLVNIDVKEAEELSRTFNGFYRK